METLALAGSRADAVLTKAVVRAAKKLGLSNSELAKTIGTSKSSVSRMADGTKVLRSEMKDFDLAVNLVRLFRSLDAITGGDEAANRSWMRSPNQALNGTPAQLITTAAGLIHVVDYLDDRRAPV
ncbi:MAG: antitoxin Xre/MbcA/ParS toxin-binding domain-containing protein [Geminicoccaceae bacterium]